MFQSGNPRLSDAKTVHEEGRRHHLDRTDRLLIRDAEGLPLYGLAMIEDITETRRAHEEAIARQKLEGLGVLAGGIAHDFNNLLGSILADLGTRADRASRWLARVRGVESIKNVADRAAEIVRQMMAYAGLEKSAFEPLDLVGAGRRDASASEGLDFQTRPLDGRSPCEPACRPGERHPNPPGCNEPDHQRLRGAGRERRHHLRHPGPRRLRPGPPAEKHARPSPERSPPLGGERYAAAA